MYRMAAASTVYAQLVESILAPVKSGSWMVDESCRKESQELRAILLCMGPGPAPKQDAPEEHTWQKVGGTGREARNKTVSLQTGCRKTPVTRASLCLGGLTVCARERPKEGTDSRKFR